MKIHNHRNNRQAAIALFFVSITTAAYLSLPRLTQGDVDPFRTGIDGA